jgi:spore maturation protein CgeB
VLKEYVGIISDAGSSLHMTLGKVFEAMASGTAVLTPWFYGSDILFGKDKCFFKYREDCTDLKTVAVDMLRDIPKTKSVIDNALNVVRDRHLHKHRILELHDILLAILNKKEVPKKWGL